MNVLRRIVLGPVPCQGCQEAVTWNGYAWENAAITRSAGVVALSR